MREINHHPVPRIVQTSVCCIKKFIPAYVIFRVEPFLLQFSPKRFSDVQMRGTGRKVKNKQASFCRQGILSRTALRALSKAIKVFYVSEKKTVPNIPQ
jgi:hypothetical protein